MLPTLVIKEYLGWTKYFCKNIYLVVIMIHSWSLAHGAFILQYYCIQFSLTGLILYKTRKEDLYPLHSNKPKILPDYKAEHDCAALLRFISLYYTLSFPFKKLLCFKCSKIIGMTIVVFLIFFYMDIVIFIIVGWIYMKLERNLHDQFHHSGWKN